MEKFLKIHKEEQLERELLLYKQLYKDAVEERDHYLKILKEEICRLYDVFFYIEGKEIKQPQKWSLNKWLQKLNKQGIKIINNANTK